ncbi:hypothetical protein GCM10027443_22180 [Pontibacter brevis]
MASAFKSITVETGASSGATGISEGGKSVLSVAGAVVAAVFWFFASSQEEKKKTAAAEKAQKLRVKSVFI